MKTVGKKIRFIAILVFAFAFILTGAILTFGGGNSYNAEAYTSSTLPSSLGSLTLSGYESRSDGLVFSVSVLNKLYGAITGSATNTYANAYKKVSDSTSTIYAPANGIANYPNTQNKSMNFTQIKTANTANGSKPITVEFGGYKWNVVYLTTNTNTNNGGTAGDLIATLWMADADGSSVWSGYTADNTTTNQRYTQNEYSVSRIHIEALNGGGDEGRQYATSNTTLASQISSSTRKNHKYAQFTMSNSTSTGVGNKSLTRFLATPKQVNYQKDESAGWSFTGTYSSGWATTNEAWDSVMNVLHYGTADNKNAVAIWEPTSTANKNDLQQCANTSLHPEYNYWVNDFLWLPSVTETGSATDSSALTDTFVSLWGIPYCDEIFQNTSVSSLWMRSGAWRNVANVCQETNSGLAVAQNSRTNSFGVRPALHLNLTKAQQNVEVIYSAINVDKPYNGNPQGIEGESWYTSNNYATKVVTKYYNSSGTAIGKPSAIGTYQVGFTPASGYVWSGGATDEKKITFTISRIKLSAPSSTTPRTYDGNSQSINSTKESWYTSSFANCVDVKYYDNGSSTPRTSDPKDANTYQVGLTPKANYAWSDGTTTEKKLDFVINKAKLNFPTISPSSYEYHGGDDRIFSIANATNSAIKIDVPSTLRDKLTYYDDTQQVIATQVGDYYLDVSLSDTANYEFKTSGTRLTFSVTKATVDVDIFGTGNSHTLQGAQGGSVSATLAVNLNSSSKHIHSGNTVKVRVYATRSGYTDIYISDTITLTDEKNHNESIELDMKRLTTGVNYNLVVKPVTDSGSVDENANYAFNMITPTALSVQSSDYRAGLTWIFKSSENGSGGPFTNVDRMDVSITQTNETFGRTVTYDGKYYSFDVMAPTGYTVQGFTITPTNLGSADPNVGIYADTYTTTVTITGSDTKTFSIQWTISKAKFDLSGVSWKGNGSIPYDKAGITMTLENLPTGLVPRYVTGTNTANDVGSAGTAIVEGFEPLTGVYANYILPDKNDTSTYEFNDPARPSGFEWTKDWTVTKAIIPIAWKSGTLQDGDGLDFNAFVLQAEGYDDVIEYRFYETDKSGQILDDSTYLTLDELHRVENVQKHYKIKAEVRSNFSTKYGVASAEYSPKFDYGEASEAVTLDLNKKQLTYNGKEQNVSVKVLTGAISSNSFDIVYYDRGGNVALTDAPKNVGLYRAEITIKAGVTGFHLDTNADNVSLIDDVATAIIEFEIVKKVIDSANWVTSHNPPSLQLTRADLNDIEYEYADIDGNPITFNQIAKGNTYKVRAHVKDFNNCEFSTASSDGDLDYTDWQEFTVSENEQLYDPTDPNNPFYPEDPDNPNPPSPDNPDNPDNPSSGDDDGKNVLDKIKDFISTGFPLWQIATMAVGALLSLIFIIKSIQYGNRKKQARNEAKKISAKAYSALLPIFATDVVALGLSNKIWSIIAFSVAGFTVLMFAVMLITRRGWKKAELAKENAIEDKEQRKFEAQQRKYEEEQKERREFQERITQVSAVNDTSSIEEILRRRDEEHRREMEALREEQAKRDEAMKIMLANMMGRQQGVDGDMGYASMDNTDLLVQKVIAGLLPMVQQMIPEPTAYLEAPASSVASESIDALTSALQQQNEQIANLQNQIANMSHTVLDAEIIPDHSEEIRAMADEHNAQIAEQNAQIAEQNAQIADLQNQIADLSQGRLEAEILPDQSEELRAMAEAHNAEMQAVTAEMQAMRDQIAMMSSMSVDELDDEDFDDEEEWDSILDEDDDDFVEAVIIDDNGNVRKTYPNFRMRLKQSSDKNREWYAVIKNMFCSQKGVTYRVYKRVEKIRYQGQVVGVIGIAKRSIKLWLALKPYEYDARRYHHKDVSDKPRFVDVPMYVRITSDRALLRAEELILALFQELNMEARKRYNDRSIQELIFTLKHNRLLTNKQYKSLLCETMHVHDCDVLDDETAEKCIENKHVDSIDDSYIATIKLDDIDANFQDGNRVTLERLKKVGLVPEDCTGFTVTAGQRLTKPLIIVANDFTLDAVKLITLTGGRAIRLTLV